MDYLHAISSYGLGLWDQGRLSSVVALGVPLGVLFHLTIAQMGDVEKFMYNLMAAMLFLALGIVSVSVFLGSSFLGALAGLCILAITFNTGLFSSMVIYRLFFHRLRRFPGPLDLKISRFFSLLRVAKEAKYHNDVVKLNERYGDFIRTGPRELCIVRDSAIPIIYGPNTNCHKPVCYMGTSPDSKKVSFHGSQDPNDHKRRHRAWDKGFSIKALQTYEPRIKALVTKLVHQISQRKIVDATTWSMYLTFDVMGEVGFGKDFGCVSDGINHPAIQNVRDHMHILGVLNYIPWLLNIFGRIPGASKSYHPFFSYCQSQVEKKRESIDLEKYPQDIMTWLLKAVIEKDISASPTESSLYDDARVLIVAGSETSATTLASSLFYLAKFPRVLKKLQAQIDDIIPTPADWTYEKAKSITYLDNVIDETQRLKPALLTGGYRRTPPEGVQIDEQFVPGNVSVIVPIQLIQTHPRYWKQSKDFIPERFGERSAEMGTSKAPYMPFSHGTYSCPGKNLALMTLRIAISSLVQHFDITFAAGETGEIFDTEAQDVFTTHLEPLNLQFSPRK
ncbi:Tryprostatin B 6-hydroxylase [Daldinia childiae]|uniref:Tryprostatin B 6-hydroxylase n=1 Tax=Daldinia childiae TaxID=326645 RepID=UPI00144558F2|nr:Tryprostatin B 6-hydroxylase [Daldinia childiae]KAF3056243.1 Tryprostatin B 6-hydroxylase [Daldinia childiae]